MDCTSSCLCLDWQLASICLTFVWQLVPILVLCMPQKMAVLWASSTRKICAAQILMYSNHEKLLWCNFWHISDGEDVSHYAQHNITHIEILRGWFIKLAGKRARQSLSAWWLWSITLKFKIQIVHRCYSDGPSPWFKSRLWYVSSEALDQCNMFLTMQICQGSKVVELSNAQSL